MAPEVPGLTLIDRLSAGGRSEVWRARNRAGRLVAVKWLRELRDDLLIRHRAEGRLLLQLGGRRHLVACLETIPDPPALVLEFLGEENLRHRIYRAGPDAHPTPLSVRDALRAVLSAADAVGWLHRHGVIHRDVKPSNLVVAADGDVRLVDLGVAAHGNPPRGLPSGWIEEQVGSLGFAAPELLRDASEAKPTLDIYGLGATLYEAVSGRLPFDFRPAEDEADLRARIAAGEPPISLSARGQFPAELSGLLARALAPRAEDRYQSVGALIEVLAALG